MSWLLVTWFLAFGWVPEQGTKLHGKLEELEHGRVSTVVQFGLDAEMFGRVHVFGDIENFQYFDGKVWFDPYRAEYTIGGSVDMVYWAELRVEHVCKHPVDANTFTTFNQSETKVIVKITGTTDF